MRFYLKRKKTVYFCHHSRAEIQLYIFPTICPHLIIITFIIDLCHRVRFSVHLGPLCICSYGKQKWNACVLDTHATALSERELWLLTFQLPWFRCCSPWETRNCCRRWVTSHPAASLPNRKCLEPWLYCSPEATMRSARLWPSTWQQPPKTSTSEKR